MIKIKNIVRTNILDLIPYSSARNDYKNKDGVFLDANENPYGEHNRYPDPNQIELKKKLANLKQVTVSNIFIGNGSDEIIDLSFRVFCEPGIDKVITFTPTYGMYEVFAKINNIELINLSLNRDFQIDIKDLDAYLDDEALKMIFICSPNNPSGNLINKKDVEYILKNFNGIVILDEAYIDFANDKTLLKFIIKYNNLIVTQTFSKAWGLAAIRVGIAYANQEIISFFDKIKPPYNVSKVNQDAAIAAINNINSYYDTLSRIILEKEKLRGELDKIDLINTIYPSDANFFLIKVDNADELYSFLVERKIITRNRNSLVSNCLRITVGTPEENNKLIQALKSIK